MIHHVFANRSNVGDWLSARGIQSLLAPLHVREHLCDEPFVAETLTELRQARPGDIIVIGGGGLFMDYFVPFWTGFNEIARRVPFCIWGVGYCDMKNESSQPPLPLLEEIVRLSRLCVVRDDLTRGHLQRCHLPPPVPCPTFTAVRAPIPAPGHCLLHVDHYDNVGQDVYEMMVREGEDFASRTGRAYRQTNNLISAGHAGELQKTLAFYSGADLVLTSRLHGCILALAHGRRVLAVSADHKVESFMEAAGLGDWVCDLDEIDLLPQRLNQLTSQPIPTPFVDNARRQNRVVGELIKTLASQYQTPRP